MKKQLQELLQGELTKRELALIPSAYDLVGDILIFADFPFELWPKEKAIGEALLSLHRHVHVIAKKTGQYSGRFRLPKLAIIAGEGRKETEHKENGVRLRLDVEQAYFSPRTGSERLRIASLVHDGESIMVMFSGCAPLPLVIARHARPSLIVGVEINPAAHRYAVENVALNKMKHIELINGDVAYVIPRMRRKFDRIAMPLPKGAEPFLPLALSRLKKGGTIHFYDFLHEGEFILAEDRIAKACALARRKYSIIGIVKCGQFSPRTFRVCVDFRAM